MINKYLIGVDLGGTQIKAVLTDPTGIVIEERATDTHDIVGKDNSAVWKPAVKRLIKELEDSCSSKIEGIGISSPGTANQTNTGILSNGTKLLGIEGLIWGDYLGRKVTVLNDAHAALIAESSVGAGIEFKNILMITLGTGIGGGIMIDGKLYQGQVGRAGHIGHLSVTKDVQAGIVNTPGSFENQIGETTVRQRSYGRFATTKDVVNAYEQGDTFGTWVWLNSVQVLARGIVSLINVISPEVIILGGGISKAGASLMNPLKDFLNIYEWRPNNFETPIRFARLSNNAGAIGAALYALEKLENK